MRGATLLPLAAVACLAVVSLRSEGLRIIRAGADGSLEWKNTASNADYRIDALYCPSEEWAPVWTATVPDLCTATVQLDAVSSPVFLRVVWTNAPSTVRYTPIGRTLQASGDRLYRLDLNDDGLFDLLFEHFTVAAGNTYLSIDCWVRRYDYRYFPGSPEHTSPARFRTNAEPAGVPIHGEMERYGCNLATHFFTDFTTTNAALHASGPWYAVSNAFLAVQLPTSQAVHYAWVQMSILPDPQITDPLAPPNFPGLRWDLHGCAVQTIPAAPLLTGQSE